jgi:hypothetical protein
MAPHPTENNEDQSITPPPASGLYCLSTLYLHSISDSYLID